MGDSDKTLSILIQLKADVAAAQQASAELKELKRQAISAGVATGDLDKQIGLAEKSEYQAADALKKGMENSTDKVHGLNRAVGLLGHQFGALGQLAHFALNGGVALGIAAVAVGLNIVVEKFREWRQRIEEAAEKIRELEISKFEKMRDAVSGAAIAQADFNLLMQHALDKQEAVKTEFEARKVLLDAEQKKVRELIKAEEDLAVARFKSANVGASPEALASGEKTIRDQFTQRNRAQDAADEAARIALDKQEEATRQANAVGLKAQANKANEAALNFSKNTDVIAVAADLEQRKKDFPTLKAAADKAGDPEKRRADLEYYENLYRENPEESSIGALSVYRSKLEAAEKAKAALDKNVAAQADQQRAVDDAAKRQKDLNDRAKTAQGDYTKNSQRLEELGRKIPSDEAVASVNRRSRGAVESLPAMTTGFQDAEQAATDARAGRKISPEQQNLLRTLGSVQAGQNVSLEQAVTIFSAAAKDKQTERMLWQRLMSAVEQMSDKGYLRQFESKLAILESRINHTDARSGL